MRTHGFLILHGWQNRRPASHWQHRLAAELTVAGHEVSYPQLPNPDHPDLPAWLDTLDQELRALTSSHRTVVAHSLSVLLWLHALARHRQPGGAPVDRVLLVAPPSPSALARYPEITGFMPPPLPGLPAVPGTLLVASDDDPYCPEGAAAVYGDPLAIPTLTLPGAAHLDVDAGYGSWPSVLDWCLDPATRITTRPR